MREDMSLSRQGFGKLQCRQGTEIASFGAAIGACLETGEGGGSIKTDD